MRSGRRAPCTLRPRRPGHQRDHASGEAARTLACRGAQAGAVPGLGHDRGPRLAAARRDTEHLDIVGVNYYFNNQWIHGTGPIDVGHPLHRPFRYLLADTFARYGRPIFVAGDRHRGRASSVVAGPYRGRGRAARVAGVPVEGLCLYPVINHPAGTTTVIARTAFSTCSPAPVAGRLTTARRRTRETEDAVRFRSACGLSWPPRACFDRPSGPLGERRSRGKPMSLIQSRARSAHVDGGSRPPAAVHASSREPSFILVEACQCILTDEIRSRFHTRIGVFIQQVELRDRLHRSLSSWIPWEDHPCFVYSLKHGRKQSLRREAGGYPRRECRRPTPPCAGALITDRATMSLNDLTSVHSRTLAAFFDTKGAAETAICGYRSPRYTQAAHHHGRRWNDLAVEQPRPLPSMKVSCSL